MERAQELLKSTITQPHLIEHALAVSASMGSMAKYFGEDVEYWEAIGLIHDYDYQQYPEEHLLHTEQPLRDAGVDEESIRAILSHGWDIVNNIKPETNMEKSLYAMDAVSGLVSAAAKMRPTGILDMAASSVTKKFKDKSFAAGVNRDSIIKGAEMLKIERSELFNLCIEGLKPHATRLGIAGK